MKKVLAVVSTILYLAFLNIIWDHVSADESYVSSQRLMNKGAYEKAISQANKSVSKNPNEPRYYYGRAKVLLASTVNNPSKKSELKELAYQNMQTAENINPKNLVTLRNLVPVYYFLASEDLTQQGAVSNIDTKYIENAKDHFNKVKNFSENDVGLPVLTAKYEKKLGLTQMYNESLLKIELLRPEILKWHPNITQ